MRNGGGRREQGADHEDDGREAANAASHGHGLVIDGCVVAHSTRSGVRQRQPPCGARRGSASALPAGGTPVRRRPPATAPSRGSYDYPGDVLPLRLPAGSPDDIRARLHVLPFWGHWQLCDIRPSDIGDGVARLAAQREPSSVRRCDLNPLRHPRGKPPSPSKITFVARTTLGGGGT